MTSNKNKQIDSITKPYNQNPNIQNPPPKKTKTQNPPNQPKSTLSDNSNLPYAIINSPKDGYSFISSFYVSGIVKNFPSNSNNHLWLVVSPRESNNCYPQYKEIRPDESTGAWSGQVNIGGDNGKLLDILFVLANSEANNFFHDYVVNSINNNFPDKPLPEGAKRLTHITVKKAQVDDKPSHSVNKYYGFTKYGIFYIHKLLIDQCNGETPCLVAGITNWAKNVKMQLDGDYYIYEAKIDKPYENNLEYCFYIGNGIHIPQILIEKSSKLILDGDHILNGTKNGQNFNTSPQDYYPGNRD